MNRQKRYDAIGEVESLTGKLDGARMGDRFQRTKPPKWIKTEEWFSGEANNFWKNSVVASPKMK